MTYLTIVHRIPSLALGQTYPYGDVIMGAIASQITSLTIVYSTVYSGADQKKYQSSASLAYVRGIHRWAVNSQHKSPVTRKMFPFDDVIMNCCSASEAILRNIYKIRSHQNMTQHNKAYTTYIPKYRHIRTHQITCVLISRWHMRPNIHIQLLWQF